ncbi:hypothetical protein [Kitasatospora cinereorecta]|uniref:Uncharacterized protein n=1 Tax=Kitasatospora cinereorecta TaxID=285560 RepID=A0ABW0VQ36_9ACTN
MTWMKAVPRPRLDGGAVAVSVLTVLGLETIALTALPIEDRPAVGGALFAANAAALGTAGVLRHRLRRRRRAEVRPAETAGEASFTARSLEGFPMDVVRPLLPGPGPVSLDRLHTAWILAAHGHDVAWIAHHLDLPSETVRPLVAAARQRHPTTGPNRAPHVPD